MTARPNRQVVVVGLFVAVALLVLTGGVLLVGRIQDAFSRKVEVSAVFEDIGGLKAGDNVWFSGLKVGTVRHLEFRGRAVQVDMQIQRVAAAAIPADALAKIGSDGLIGSRIVVLFDGGTGVLADGDVLEVGPSVSMEDMKATLQENNLNVLAITTDLKGLTARLAAGEGSAGKLLADQELYDQVQSAVASLGHASTSLSTFSAKLNEPGHLPNDLVTDEALFAKLSGSVDDLKTVGQQATRLVGTLEEGATSPDSVVGTLVADPASGAQLKVTLENLNQASERMNEDLEALQHNLLLRGYFKKKAKEEGEAPAEP